MNVFFDTEFTGLVPDTSLISVGMIAETGEKFYAEFTDYAWPAVIKDSDRQWIEDNVISNLLFKDKWHDDASKPFEPELRAAGFDDNDDDMFVRGKSNYIRDHLIEWFEMLRRTHGSDMPVQLISDCCHYDMYLLCSLFGGASNLQKYYVNPVCYDINQDLANLFSNNENESVLSPYPGGMLDAFNTSREDWLVEHKIELPTGAKHNALYDAEVIKKIYDYIQSAVNVD